MRHFISLSDEQLNFSAAAAKKYYRRKRGGGNKVIQKVKQTVSFRNEFLSRNKTAVSSQIGVNAAINVPVVPIVSANSTATSVQAQAQSTSIT